MTAGKIGAGKLVSAPAVRAKARKVAKPGKSAKATAVRKTERVRVAPRKLKLDKAEARELDRKLRELRKEEAAADRCKDRPDPNRERRKAGGGGAPKRDFVPWC